MEHLSNIYSSYVRNILISLGSINYRITETAIKTLARKERYVMVIRNGLILSPDFLHFMSQLVTIADIDRSIIGISAWNVNGNGADLLVCGRDVLLHYSSMATVEMRAGSS